ncbi:MAG: hypothetical protein ACTSWQ_08685 [Candidatus Thorarchaeota archaeon]
MAKKIIRRAATLVTRQSTETKENEMAKRIVRKATLVNRNGNIKSDRTVGEIGKNNRDISGYSPLEFIHNDHFIVDTSKTGKISLCERYIISLESALEDQNIEYIIENGEFLVGDLIVNCTNEGYEINGEEIGNKPIDVIRMANRMVRSQEMAPIEKGKKMSRIDMLKKRAKKLGMNVELRASHHQILDIEPKDEDLMAIEAAEPVEIKKKEVDEEEMTSVENDVAIEYLCGGIVDDTFMPEISKEEVDMKSIDRNVEMTEGLIFQMESLGLDPNEAEGCGEIAIMLIEEAEGDKVGETKKKKAFNAAYRNYVRAIFGMTTEKAAMFGHEDLDASEMEQLIKMSY